MAYSRRRRRVGVHKLNVGGKCVITSVPLLGSPWHFIYAFLRWPSITLQRILDPPPTPYPRITVKYSGHSYTECCGKCLITSVSLQWTPDISYIVYAKTWLLCSVVVRVQAVVFCKPSLTAQLPGSQLPWTTTTWVPHYTLLFYLGTADVCHYLDLWCAVCQKWSPCNPQGRAKLVSKCLYRSTVRKKLLFSAMSSD